MAVWDVRAGIAVISIDGSSALYPTRRDLQGTLPYHDWVEARVGCASEVIEAAIGRLERGKGFRECETPGNMHVRATNAGRTVESIFPFGPEGDERAFREHVIHGIEACIADARSVPLLILAHRSTTDPTAMPWTTMPWVGAQSLEEYTGEPSTADDAASRAALASLHSFAGSTTQRGATYRVRVFPDSQLANLWSGDPGTLFVREGRP